MLLGVGFVISYPGWGRSEWDNQAQAQYVYGNALLRSRQPKLALEKFLRAKQIDSTYKDVNLNIGVAFLQLGDTLSALTAFTDEVRLNPSSATGFNNLGILSEAVGDLDRAEAQFRTALTITPYYRDAVVNLARVYLKQGDSAVLNSRLPSAQQFYHKALGLNPQDHRPSQRLSFLFRDLGVADSANYYERLSIATAGCPR